MSGGVHSKAAPVGNHVNGRPSRAKHPLPRKIVIVRNTIFWGAGYCNRKIGFLNYFFEKVETVEVPVDSTKKRKNGMLSWVAGSVHRVRTWVSPEALGICW